MLCCSATGAASAIGYDADYPDYIENLMLTVLDLQLYNVIVNNAIILFRRERATEIRTLAQLEEIFDRFPDDVMATGPLPVSFGITSTGIVSPDFVSLSGGHGPRGLVDQTLLRWAHESNSAEISQAR